MEDRLVEDNINLVHHIVRKINPRLQGYTYYDWVQIGLFGLHKATKSFDSSRGYKFITYAGTFIRNEIFTELRNQQTKGRYSGLDNVSLDIIINSEDKSISLLDIQKSDEDILQSVISSVEGRTIKKAIDLCTVCPKTEVLKKMVYKQITPKEAQILLGVSQPQVSRSLTKFRKNCGDKYNQLMGNIK